MEQSKQADHLNTLTEIGIALSSERDLNTLLDRILQETMDFANAEGGSLYIKEEDKLRFAVTRNEKIKNGEGGRTKFVDSSLPISEESISGYVAKCGEIVNIADAYKIPEEAPYEFDSSFDEQYDYRTRSLIGLPMQNREEEVIGVLLLVNARTEDGEITSFPENQMDVLRSLASQAAVALQNADLTEKLKDAYLETIYRLSVAAEHKDLETSDHIQRISKYTEIIADSLGLDEEKQEDLLYASPMHDIGKIGVSDRILLKNGDLTDEEYEEMKQHTVIGHDILKGSDSEIMRLSATIALTHHEKWDGTGYPRGLEKEEIPLEGRIVAVADVFDALTMERPYKDAFSIEKSIGILKEDTGTHFDPEIIDAFLDVRDRILHVRKYYKENNEFERHPLEKGIDMDL